MTTKPCDNTHDECLICLCPLLGGESDEDDIYIEPTCPEVGAVWPCGHCFHLACWNRWKKEKCPTCNQPANLFSKIFISSPSPAAASGDLSNGERQELERYRLMAREEKSERMLLRDMERQVEDDPQGAKTTMTMMLMVQSRDLRKAERALEKSREECQMTKDILRVARSELDEAATELAYLKPKTEQLQEEVDRLQQSALHYQAARHRHREDKKQIAMLQEKLERAKDKLALKNKQLSRRNKELDAKRKVISPQKIELASPRGGSRKAAEELERTKKELEILKELDSFTMEDSSGSLGLSLIWDL